MSNTFQKPRWLKRILNRKKETKIVCKNKKSLGQKTAQRIAKLSGTKAYKCDHCKKWHY